MYKFQARLHYYQQYRFNMQSLYFIIFILIIVRNADCQFSMFDCTEFTKNQTLKEVDSCERNVDLELSTKVIWGQITFKDGLCDAIKNKVPYFFFLNIIL